MCEAGTTTVYRDEPVSIVEAVAFGDRVHGAVYLHLGLLYVVLGEDVHEDLLLLLLGLGRRGRRRGLVHVQLRSWPRGRRGLLRTLRDEQEEDRDSNYGDRAEDDQGTPVTGRHGHVLTSWRGTGDGGSACARGALLAAWNRAGACVRVGGEEVRRQREIEAW